MTVWICAEKYTRQGLCGWVAIVRVLIQCGAQAPSPATGCVLGLNLGHYPVLGFR